MTEERRRYLAGISNEELYIRRRIAILENLNKQTKREWEDIKKEVYRASYVYEAFKADKNIIKALKKHLPQRMFLVDAEWGEASFCPTCRNMILKGEQRLDISRSYCPCCGQRLTDEYGSCD